MFGKTLLSAICCVAGAWAQADPPVQRELVFTPGDTPRAMQELVNTLRAVAMSQAPSAAVQKSQLVSFDLAQRKVTVQGLTGNVDLAQWIFDLLETDSVSPDRHEFVVPGSSNDVARVFGPPHIADIRQLQEMINALRLVAQIQRVVGFTPQKSIALRGQAWQTDLAEWLIAQLDSPPPGQSSAAYTISGAQSASGVPFPAAVRIFYLPPTASADLAQQTANIVRSQAQIMRVVAYPAQRAIVLRGTETQAAAAAQIVSTVAR